MKKTGLNKRPPKLKSTASKESKYIKLLSTDPIEKFDEMGELIQKRKIKWAYYKLEDSVGVHYYLKLK
jgi:hypothetical protein